MCSFSVPVRRVSPVLIHGDCETRRAKYRVVQWPYVVALSSEHVCLLFLQVRNTTLVYLNVNMNLNVNVNRGSLVLHSWAACGLLKYLTYKCVSASTYMTLTSARRIGFEQSSSRDAHHRLIKWLKLSSDVAFILAPLTRAGSRAHRRLASDRATCSFGRSRVSVHSVPLHRLLRYGAPLSFQTILNYYGIHFTLQFR